MSNPYELRFKVLEMARDAEMSKYEVQMNAFWTLHNEICEKLNMLDGRVDERLTLERLTELASTIEKAFPEMPTSEAIKKKAAELYEFVEQKGK
mgnify:CR=1 FL=1